MTMIMEMKMKSCGVLTAYLNSCSCPNIDMMIHYRLVDDDYLKRGLELEGKYSGVKWWEGRRDKMDGTVTLQ
jgi:hypothetical protein